MRWLLLSLCLSISSCTLDPCKNGAAPSSEVELDILKHDGPIPKPEMDQLIHLYESAVKEESDLRAEMGVVKGRLFKALIQEVPDQWEIDKQKANFTALQEKQINSMVSTFEQIAVIVTKYGADRDMVYRSFLREHRRRIPGFNH